MDLAIEVWICLFLLLYVNLVAQYPKRNLSRASYSHKVYPCLLRGWATDVTYIPMACGFVSLVAVMDWYSRRVLPL